MSILSGTMLDTTENDPLPAEEAPLADVEESGTAVDMTPEQRREEEIFKSFVELGEEEINYNFISRYLLDNIPTEVESLLKSIDYYRESPAKYQALIERLIIQLKSSLKHKRFASEETKSRIRKLCQKLIAHKKVLFSAGAGFNNPFRGVDGYYNATSARAFREG